jgi:hypothetical protein
MKTWTVEEMSAAISQFYETRNNEVDALRRIYDMALNAAYENRSDPVIWQIEADARAALGIKNDE